jgi:hypothetical protein
MQPANRYAVLSAIERAFPDAPPLGYELRERYPERWFRIHSLPLSKRLPESALDRTTLYNRQQAVASHLFGMGTPVIVLIYDWSRRSTIPRNHPLADMVPEDLEPVIILPPVDDDPDLPPTSIYALEFAWDPSVLYSAIQAVAEDRASFAVLEPVGGAFFAPYDGGADVFYPSPSLREEAVRIFDRIRAPGPSGL